jgi:hypothetical protein
METVKMTVAQWGDVMTNPRQRNTEARAIKASRKHLKTASPAQSRVWAARLPGGSLVKLDGHTRSLLWGEGKLTPPPVVYVDVIVVKSMNEAKDLYSQFDGSGPTETATDRVFGAFRECGIEPESGLIAGCRLTSALSKLATSGTPIYQIVKQWKPELKLLDSVDAGQKSMTAGMVLGALCALRVRGERALPFLSAVVRDAGERDERGSDGVDAIVRHIKSQNGKATGEAAVRDVAGRFITAFEGWLQSRRFRQAVRPTDFSDYLARKS